MSENEPANDELAQLLMAKDAELKTLYRLVNKYKDQITDLDVAVVNRDITIEELRGRLAAIGETNQAAE